MYQISNEKFGLFVLEMRKEKKLTQKELAEKLFVSDKTVSKWERGLSMPNVALLIPLAEVLEITVTELLRGERMASNETLDTSEVEGLVVSSLDLTIQHTLSQRRKKWMIAFFVCLLIASIEGIILFLGETYIVTREHIFMVMGLMAIFSGWLCFFAKELLPNYYDNNKVNYYTQGVVRIHMPGLSFNNSNWNYIGIVLKIGTLATMILYPLLCLLVSQLTRIEVWETIKNSLLLAMLGGMLIATYIVGKKYE